jgi:post-segregation antitoxin (ccd killing protein)
MTALKEALSPIKDIQIVVSSSWREEMDLSTLQDILAELAVPVIDVTPVIDDAFLKNIREHECRSWLKENATSTYFAIDDTKGFFSEEFPVFWVDGGWGFNDELLPAFDEFIDALTKSSREPSTNTTDIGIGNLEDCIIRFDDMPEDQVKELKAFVVGRSCPPDGVWAVDFKEWLREKRIVSIIKKNDPGVS